MVDCYIGEIRMFAGNYAPEGWELCNGQELSISGNEALYSLLGTTYGGNGTTSFALPDLRGRVPVHLNSQYPLGSKGGTETVTLTASQIPAHTHPVLAAQDIADQPSPQNTLWATTAGIGNYSDMKDSSGQPITPVQMNANNVVSVGANQPHNNMMPSLTISFIIALQGIYPIEA